MFTTTFLAAALLADPRLAAAAPAAELVEHVAPERRSFNGKRAALEIGGALALGATWYQSEIELNKLDFDFARTWSDQWRRVSTAAGYRFDDNNLTLNVGHAMVGAYYHQFARANGGGMLEAMAFDLVTSTSWELLVEHREVISVNDTIATALGGVSVGEGLYQLGDYFARSRPTLVNRLLMSVVSPAHLVGWLTGDRPTPSAAGFDRFGLAADATHDFRFGVGAAQALSAGSDGGNWTGALRVDLELVNLPESGRAATRYRRMHGGELTRLGFEYVGTRDVSEAVSFTAHSSLWGVSDQATRVSDGGGLDGRAIFLGSATALEVSSQAIGNTGSKTNDFLCAVHLPGPATDATFYRNQWRFRLAADAMPDFAMVRPLTVALAPDASDRSGMKSTLPTFGYYYAFGLATSARLEAAFRKARAGLHVGYGYYDSIEGLDRHQEAYTSPTGVFHEAVADDSDLTDQRLKLRAFSELPVPTTDVRLGVSVDYQQRKGVMFGATSTGDSLRWGVHAAYAL